MSGRTVFAGGTVWTGDADRPRARRVVVEGGRIAGLDGDVRPGHAGGSAEYVDLAGGCLLPAFRDGHAHPLQGGLELAGVPLAGAASVEAAVAAVGRWAGEHRNREWVVGGGYDPSLAAGGCFEAAWLDAAVPDRPVFLLATDHHTAWVNSVALRLAGIDTATPDPPRGSVVRRPDGAPLGTLREAAVALVERLVPVPSVADLADGLDLALRRFAAAGIAWVQDAWVEPARVPGYLAAAARGGLACRLDLALLVPPHAWREQRTDILAARDLVRRDGGELITAHAVKLFVDGIIEGGTAALTEPYLTGPGLDTAAPCGLPNWSPPELGAAVATYAGDGFQPHLHAIGDAAIRHALDALAQPAVAGRRPVIAHVQLPRPEDLTLFAAAGVVANVEPLWAQLDRCMTELTIPRLGQERSAWQYPLRSLLDSGARVSFGSDWPVSSLRPLDGIAVAVTRQTADGEPSDGWLPHERILLEEALRAYTAGTAYQGFDDDAGVLRVGARADLVWLAADPTAVPPAELPDLPVLGTWCSGRRTH